MYRYLNINLAFKFIFSFCSKKRICLEKVRVSSGVTLVELMTVMVILGVSVSMFYTVWFSNWQTFDYHTAIADLWFDANKIAEEVSMDGRAASLITVDTSQKSVIFVNSLGTTTASYLINSTGQFIITRGASTTIVSQRIDFNNTNFVQRGSGLRVDLFLVDEEVLGQADAEIETHIEIFPRN